MFQVGLMRDGILLAENTPASLIQEHHLSVRVYRVIILGRTGSSTFDLLRI